MTEQEKEEFLDRFDKEILKGRIIAENMNMHLSKFKSLINKLDLSKDFDEDEWTYYYQCYLHDLADGYKFEPEEWIKNHLQII